MYYAYLAAETQVGLGYIADHGVLYVVEYKWAE
jgi:hypothetical protein